MALDERYIIASDLEQYFVDKDSGLPLAGGTLAFYRNSAPNTAKDVFQLSGAYPNYTYTALPNPITLSSVGTVQNAGGDNEVIYYYPFDDNGDVDLYYVVCRNSNGVEQFTREAWPNVTAGNDPTNEAFPISNQVSNPQFTKVLINDNGSTTYTVAAATNQVFAFAPDWDFVISGTGTVIVSRVAVSGNDNIPTSPPYVLDITVSANITACYLRQRMAVNSGLWASTDNQDIYLAANIVARNENAGTTGVQIFYDESSGGAPITILDKSFDNSGYVALSDATASAIPLSTNTDTGTSGYIDIYVSLLPSSHVRISSVQVVPTTSSAGPDLLLYDLNSSNREQALLGDYYIPRLVKKTAPSLLTGWDFGLNPAQFGEVQSISGASGYIWDQTFAQGSTASVVRNAVTGGLQITTGVNTGVLLLGQYLSGKEAKKILGTRLSVNINAFRANGGAVAVNVFLCRGSSAATFPTMPTMIGTLGGGGAFNISQPNWTEIPRSGLPTASGTIPLIATNADLNNDIDLGFSGWELTSSAQIGDTDKFAIIVTLAWPDTNTAITFNSISLIPGDLPCRPSPQTADDVLRECRYYYEKSYNLDVAPGTVTAVGERMALTPTFLTGGISSFHPFSYQLKYEHKRTTPTVAFYNRTSSTVDRVLISILRNNLFPVPSIGTNPMELTQSTSFLAIGASPDSTWYGATATSAAAPIAVNPGSVGDQNVIFYHFVADARLGVV